MNDKKIKEAMKQYIETQADNISSESEEKHDLTSLDEKVYAMLGTNQNKHKTAAVWSFRKISALAATFVLVISLSITAVFVLNKEPEHIAQDVFYSITISYENEQYGYFSNRLVIDKYGLNNISDLKQNPDLFTGILTETDIIQTDSVIDKDSIIGANLTGIRSILVAPIDPHEEIQIVLKRFIEKPVIACYKRHLKTVSYTHLTLPTT